MCSLYLNVINIIVILDIWRKKYPLLYTGYVVNACEEMAQLNVYL